jgi:hypothetical protein
VWERLDRETVHPVALADLPVRSDLKPVGLTRTLGRRWRKDDRDFWCRLSPLGAGRPEGTEEEVQITPRPTDPEGEAFVARLRHLREAQLEEARRDAAGLGSAEPDRDLRSSTINGSMDDREDDAEEEPWQ